MVSGAAAETVGAVGGGSVHRTLVAEVTRVRAARPDRPPRVLDVGGGSGAWAVPLARSGCAVTVVDNSPNALAALHRRAREAGVHELVTPVQGDVDALADVVPPGGADLVLGHGLLEVVDDAAAAVSALTTATAAGGAVSVLVVGRYAAVLARTLSGRLAEARAVLTDPDGRFGADDALRRRLDAATLRGLLEDGAALRVEVLQGDGVLEGWVPSAVRDGGPAAARAVAELEDLAAAAAPLVEMSARLHALARRPG
ncbi:class I SAM-dependent methyltransferase [Pseudonocardia xinjiangensis]|uniref:Class I SAM-dependent methyltransferase n=1 Tax=Pseudonocardia xinjiangensis TaxID=75289 RepID=A0ABX1RN39_9PSEU|nr:class I SAM-dependent methyltransferase [Pseudonocardia xinjiangensis]NMH81793.1 class I SAM-dependent methyltransferase [Pseudonocardia xinjiangensis]